MCVQCVVHPASVSTASWTTQHADVTARAANTGDRRVKVRVYVISVQSYISAPLCCCLGLSVSWLWTNLRHIYTAGYAFGKNIQLSVQNDDFQQHKILESLFKIIIIIIIIIRWKWKWKSLLPRVLKNNNNNNNNNNNSKAVLRKLL